MKAFPSQPWRKIADLAGGRGVQAEWQNFPAELLTLTNDEATAIPCNGRSGCYMNVVKHGPGDIVGICTSEAKQCDRRTLSKTEIAIYRLNHQQLAKKIAEAIGFTEDLEQISGQGPLWKLGALNPQAEHNFTVYCFLGQTASQLEKVINQLCMINQTPFLLLASFSGQISAACSDASNRHKSKVLGIDDILSANEAGGVQGKENAQTVVQRWLDNVLPKSAKPGSEYRFPTPAGATWEQFVFEFTATEMLLVTCGKIVERLEPEHLKMKNQRSGKPTLQWTLLRSLAVKGGSLTWQDDDATDRVKKQKQELANKLKATFQLTDDPIPHSDSEKTYKARFVIKAADNVLRQLKS
jgi:hypothetical protein